MMPPCLLLLCFMLHTLGNFMQVIPFLNLRNDHCIFVVTPV